MRTPYAPIPVPNVAHMLWRTAAASPERFAIVSRAERVQYGALRDRAVAVGVALREMGVRPDDRVAVFLERGADAAAVYFGAAAIGANIVNVNEGLRPRQVEHILEHSDARVIVTSGSMLARQPRPLETRAAVLDVAQVPASPGVELEPVARMGTDLVQIIYTSGSTGMPKGVALSHANVWAWMGAVVDYLGITAEDRIASLLPFSYVYGFNQLLCAVATGATLVVEGSPLPPQIVATLKAEQVTVLAAVPPLWLQLLGVSAFAEQPLPSLRVMTNAGGRIPVDAVLRLRKAQPDVRLYLMYGSTEALRSTYLDPADVDAHPNSIGKAIPGAQILVMRDDGTHCDVDEVGELVHRGPTVAPGYWADPETTARVFRPNPLRAPGAPEGGERVFFSGDMVKMDAEGFLYHVGRRDRMIKVLGYRVSPDEIGEVLYASGEAAEVVMDAEPDDQRGYRIIAYVVLKETGSVERLNAFARSELPRHMHPARVEVRSEIPRNGNGKHDLAATRAPVPVAVA